MAFDFKRLLNYDHRLEPVFKTRPEFLKEVYSGLAINGCVGSDIDTATHTNSSGERMTVICVRRRALYHFIDHVGRATA